jgi:organic hydroperoxide reductase OsmC/OhrA
MEYRGSGTKVPVEPIRDHLRRMTKEHRYASELNWTGNTGTGYEAYSREHTVRMGGKQGLIVSSDPAFRGDPTKHNPEDLLLAALSSCHLLTYLALCARARIAVVGYVDRAEGTMGETPDGGGRFTEVVLRPLVTVTSAEMVAKATRLHEAAGKYCFIANSVNFLVRHEPIVRVAGD